MDISQIITRDDASGKIDGVAKALPNLYKPESFGNKANKYRWTYRDVPCTIIGNMSVKYVEAVLTFLANNDTYFMRNYGYDIAAQKLSQYLKKSVRPVDIQKNTILDHVQVEKNVAFLGFNTTDYDSKLFKDVSLLVAFKDFIGTKSYKYAVMLTKWKK